VCFVIGAPTVETLPAEAQQALQTLDPEKEWRAGASKNLWDCAGKSFEHTRDMVAWRLDHFCDAFGYDKARALAEYRERSDRPVPTEPGLPSVQKERQRWAFVGAPRFTADELLSYFRGRGASKEYRETVPHYYRECENQARRHGWQNTLAPDALLLQSAHETGLWRWTGASRKWQMAGVKKAGARGDAFEDFEPCPNLARGFDVHHNYMAVWCGVPTRGFVPPRAQQDLPPVVRSKGVIRTYEDIGGHVGRYATDPAYREALKRYEREAEKSAGK
jgi:hypothetical protein